MGLSWDSSYAIVLELKAHYPDVDVDAVGLHKLYQMIMTLPNFDDDPELANDAILADILGEWYEEVNS